MSPRRSFRVGAPPLFVARQARPADWYRIPLLGALVVLIACAAVTICAQSLIRYESARRESMREVAALSDVRSFMTLFTSPDPFDANGYVDHVLARVTGEFATRFREQANRTLAQVARSQPATGTVLDAGVERWNDDGSANVLVATEVRSKSVNGKGTDEVAYRWLVTAEQEGSEWKISSLIPVL